MDTNIRIAEVFPNLNELISNKYVITILVAYYALTRMVTIQEADIYLQKESSIKLIFEEIIRYLAGETIYIECHDKEKDIDGKKVISLVMGMPIHSSEDFLDMVKIYTEKAINEDKVQDENSNEEEKTPKVTKKKRTTTNSAIYTHPDILTENESSSSASA